MDNKHSDSHGESNHESHHESHGTSHYVKIWAILTVLLVVSICGPMVGIRWLTMVTAFGIAIVKATMVAREFMHLKVERKIVSYILLAMLVLVSIFFFGVAPDVMKAEGTNWVKSYDEVAAEAAEAKNDEEHEHGGGAEVAEESAEAKHEEAAKPATAAAAGVSKFAKAWIATPELLAHGKGVFQANCVTCHGAEGKGDGAASAALNPKPRNFTGATGWKQGRKPTQIFHTISTGLGGMPSFASMTTDDRWSVVHYVRSFGPHAGEKDTLADFKKAGIDPTKDNGGIGPDQVIPIGLAIDQLVADSSGSKAEAPKKAKK